MVEPWIEGLWDALLSLFDQEPNEKVCINTYAETMCICPLMYVAINKDQYKNIS